MELKTKKQPQKLPPYIEEAIRDRHNIKWN